MTSTSIGPGEMRARQRSGVILTLAALRLVAGLCLAMPLASLLGASGIGERVEGDRALFEAGGYLLLEVLRVQTSALTATLRGLLPVLLLGLTLTVASNAALLVALNTRGRLVLRSWLGSALERVPPLLLLGAATTVAQGIVLVLAGLLTDALPQSPIRPVAASATQVGAWALAAILAGALGGFADVVKASLVRHESRLRDAFFQAFTCTLRSPLRSLLGWLPYAALLLLAVLAAGKLTEICDVSRAGAWRVATVFIVHQLVVVLSVTLRAAWFARVLRLAAAT